jgi:hypothetical protein
MNVLRGKDRIPDGRVRTTEADRLSLAPIGGEGWGEGAGLAIQIGNTVLL